MLAGRKAFVTGASGFVGSNLVRALLGNRCEVIALARPSSDLWRLRDLSDQISWRFGELSDVHSLATVAPEDVQDLVFHVAAAGVSPAEDPVRVVATNLYGSCNLLNLIALSRQCSRFVFCSSCSVYGQGAYLAEDAALEGSSVYALTKIAAEALCKAYGAASRIPWVALRLFTPYGPYESSYRLVAGTIRRALNGQDLSLTYGEQARDFIYIGDVVRSLIAAALLPGIENNTINICAGNSVKVKEIVELILTVHKANRHRSMGPFHTGSTKCGRCLATTRKCGHCCRSSSLFHYSTDCA